MNDFLKYVIFFIIGGFLLWIAILLGVNFKQPIDKIPVPTIKVKMSVQQVEALEKIGIIPAKKEKTNIQTNALFFRNDVYFRLKFEECGKCLKICHNPPKSKDTGLLTCKGFSFKWFPDIVLHIINTPWGSDTQRELYVRKQYWNIFAKRYANCNPSVFALLLDSAVNEGHNKAIRRHQKINNLVVDGKWGKQSLSACLKAEYPAKAFVNDRIGRAGKLNTAKTNLNGWTKRSMRKLKEFKTDLKLEKEYKTKTTAKWLDIWCSHNKAFCDKVEKVK